MLTHHHCEPENPARVVVLGSGGFIGRTLLAALDQAGIPTLGLSRVELDLATDGASERLATMLRTTDAVVLLAALTPNKGRGIPPFLANIRIAANVCTALGAVTPAHVVYFSSDALYPMDIGRITETSCAQPADLYGMMHLTRETMLKASTRTPLAVLRPTLIYGAADPHNSYGPNRFRRMAHHEGKITLFGAGEELRDHLLVDDAVALTRLVLCHRSSGTLNLATGRSIAYSALAKKIAALFDKPIDIVLTPRQNPITYRHFDITALHKAFPTYTFTPLDTGLAKVHRDMLERE